jgi:hypothetical protein
MTPRPVVVDPRDAFLERCAGGSEVRCGYRVLGVVAKRIQPVLNVADGLFCGFGQVHRPNEPPFAAIRGRTKLSRALLHHVPEQMQQVEALLDCRTHRQQAYTVLSS